MDLLPPGAIQFALVPVLPTNWKLGTKVGGYYFFYSSLGVGEED